MTAAESLRTCVVCHDAKTMHSDGVCQSCHGKHRSAAQQVADEAKRGETGVGVIASDARWGARTGVRIADGFLMHEGVTA